MRSSVGFFAYDHKPWKVVAEPDSLYFGAKLSDQSLVLGANPHLGPTNFDRWLTYVPPPPQRV